MATSHAVHNDSSHQPEEQGMITAANEIMLDPISYAAQPATPASGTSTKSTGTDPHSSTSRGRSFLGVPPHSAPHQAGTTITLASSPTGLILAHLTSLTRSASPATSPIGLTTSVSASTPSVETTEPEETDSSSEALNLRGGDGELGTPATSDTSAESDNIFTAGHDDDDDDDQDVFAQDRDSALLGLDLPDDYLNRPLFCPTNDDGGTNLPEEILEELLNYERTKLQVRPDAIPWGPGTDDIQWPISDNASLAPDPGPAYKKYYSSTRMYSWENKKIQRNGMLASSQPDITSFVSSRDRTVIGTPQSPRDISSCVLPQCSGDWIESRGTGSGGWHNIGVERISESLQQPKIYRQIDLIPYSVEETVSIFHPSFLVSHLFQSSSLASATKLNAPNGLIHSPEYTINLSLGFGPHISLHVCTFAPKDNEALRSYQQHRGKGELDVQYSFPIALDLFSVEAHAEEINIWLDGIIDSESQLLGYMDLMLRRQQRDHSAQILNYLVSWYLRSQTELVTPADYVLRTALKLVMTTTLLSLVPRVTYIPESLSDYFASQSSSHGTPLLSADAPKLLTRQIKASIFHLHQDLLSTLFYQFRMRLAAETRVAAALLVAFVLELVRNAGRQFAKFAQTINSSVVVCQKDVTAYESKMQMQVFETIRAGVQSAFGKTGRLGQGLMELELPLKGKGKETQDCSFVQIILDTLE